MMSNKCHRIDDFLYSQKKGEQKKLRKKEERRKREVIVKSRVSVNLLILVKSMFAEMIGLHEQISLGILLMVVH